MLGNVNLNTLMNMFSGLGAGGGLGVPNAPNGQYAFHSADFSFLFNGWI
jgi:hypothetical protein